MAAARPPRVSSASGSGATSGAGRAAPSTGAGGAARSVFGRQARDRAGSAFNAVKTSKGSAAHEGAGFILGTLVWCWVVLPFMSGGLVGMKNTLRAKFINEGPDGKPL